MKSKNRPQLNISKASTVPAVLALTSSICLLQAAEVVAQGNPEAGNEPKAEYVKRDRPMKDERLTMRMSKARADEKIKVNVAFLTETVDGANEPVGADIGTKEGPGGKPELEIILNGKPATPADAMRFNQSVSERGKAKAAAVKARNDQRRLTVARRHGWDTLPAFDEMQESDSSTLTIELTPSEIAQVERGSARDVLAIEEWVPPETTVASSMVATRVAQIAHARNARGSGVTVYVSEGGCPATGFTSNYVRLNTLEASTRAQEHAANVVGIVRSVAPDSRIICRQGYALPTSGDRTTYTPKIATQSWGWTEGGYNSNTADWDNLAYNTGMTVFFAAGNTRADGTVCGTNPASQVAAPGQGLNMITVGAYDDANDGWANFSCYGPSLTKANKPEISAPGVNVTAGGYTKSGTSMATPHAAAFMATLTGSNAYSWMLDHPALIKAHLMATARDPIVGSFDQVGSGGIDMNAAFFNWYGWWREGSNSSWFDRNEEIRVSVTLDQSVPNARFALAWLSRGAYTLARLNDSVPIGMDLDLRVLNPSGTTACSSVSAANPYEVCSFDPTVTGTYTVIVKRYANRDTLNDVRVGIVADW